MNEIQLKIIVKVIEKMKSITPCDLISPLSIDKFRFFYSKEKQQIIEIKREKALKGIFHSGLFFIYLNNDKIAQVESGKSFYNEIDKIIKSIVLSELEEMETEHLKEVLKDLEND